MASRLFLGLGLLALLAPGARANFLYYYTNVTDCSGPPSVRVGALWAVRRRAVLDLPGPARPAPLPATHGALAYNTQTHIFQRCFIAPSPAAVVLSL